MVVKTFQHTWAVHVDQRELASCRFGELAITVAFEGQIAKFLTQLLRLSL